MNSLSPEDPPPADDLLPATPATVEDSGLDFGFLADLALKTVYADTSCTTQRAAERLALPPAVVDLLLQHLYRERLIEIRETITPQNRRYAMLDRGWERVRRLLDLNAYIGAAPVSLDAYTAMVKRQEELRPPVKPDAIRAAVADLVLPDTTQQLLGVVANSRRSLFITGAPGQRQDLDRPGPPSGARRRDMDSPGHRGRRPHHQRLRLAQPLSGRSAAARCPTTSAGSRSGAPSWSWAAS